MDKVIRKANVSKYGLISLQLGIYMLFIAYNLFTAWHIFYSLAYVIYSLAYALHLVTYAVCCLQLGIYCLLLTACHIFLQLSMSFIAWHMFTAWHMHYSLAYIVYCLLIGIYVVFGLQLGICSFFLQLGICI